MVPHRPVSDLESIFEAQGPLRANPAQALATLKALGVDRVRMYLPWDQLAPDPTSAAAPDFDAFDPAAYPAANWGIYDEIVRDAAAIGIGLDVTVGAPPPLWAAGPGGPRRAKPAAQWKPSSVDFGAFVHALGVRYSGHYIPPGATTALPRIDFWSIWNEPNYGPYLAPQAIENSNVEVSPRLYRSLLDAAWRALLETGHTPRTDTILIGETAPRGVFRPGDFNGMLPLRFIRALYCVGESFRPLRGAAATLRGCPSTAGAASRFVAQNPGLFDASGWADHPYPDQQAPDQPEGIPGYADFPSLGDLEATLDRAAAAYRQHPHMPIYSTEFGYRTDPPNATYGVPLATAARYLNQAEYLSWLNPRIRSYDQYLLIDPPVGGDSLFVTGLEFADGRPKPDVYDAFRMPLYLPVTHGSRGSSLLVWGCVRPAPEARRRTGRAQRVAIQFAPRRSGRFRTVRTIDLSDPHGYFDADVAFPGSGTVRLEWAGSGTPVYSRLQPITLR